MSRPWTLCVRQFSLRTMLCLMVLCALLLVAWNALRRPDEHRAVEMYLAANQRLRVRWQPTLPQAVQGLVDQEDFRKVIELDVADVDYQPKHLPHLMNLRSVQRLAIAGTQFTLSDLQHICQLPELELLVLDCTSVDAAQLSQLKKPDRLTIRLSQRRAIAQARRELGLVNRDFRASFRIVDVAHGSHGNMYHHHLGQQYYKQNLYALCNHQECFASRDYQIADYDHDEKAYELEILNPDLASLRPARFLDSLEWLDARGILLDEAALEPVGHLPLKVLQLGYRANWNEQQLAGISHLEQLEAVLIADCRLTDCGLAELATLKHLRTLWIPGTDVTGSALADLDAEGLESLDLSYTSICDRELAHLARFTDLTALSLGRTHISDKGLAHLGQLKKLRVLLLDGTGVSDQGLTHLNELVSLERLSLARTNVTDAGLTALQSLRNLNWLDISETNTSKAASDALATFLPHNPIVR